MPSQNVSLAILPDFKEEDWPSMDLVAEKLLEYLPNNPQLTCQVYGYEPKFRRIATAMNSPFRAAARFNLDRLFNRLALYPRQAKRLAQAHDLFHVTDHTYAALVHALPPDRTGVYCHDLDAFRCLIEPENESRPWWFRKMASRILTGMQKAAIVFHNSMFVRESILANGLIDEAKLVHAPLGVAEEFCLSGSRTLAAGRVKTDVPGSGPAASAIGLGESGSKFDWIDKLQGRPWIAHVGTCISRKRIDVLLDVLASVQNLIPDLMLVKIGGEFTRRQQQQIESLNLTSSIIHLSGIQRSELAEVYRRAAAVLITSAAEGFGLPMIEALACGAPVIASDIAVLREVGQTAGIYCPVADIPAWAEIVVATIEHNDGPDLSTRLAVASQYTWQNHANIIAEAYQRVHNAG